MRIKTVKIILQNIRFITQSRIRVCRCCEKHSLIVSLSPGEERKLCLRCRANLRYEMLGQVVRNIDGGLWGKTIVELDPRSPLRHLFEQSDKYFRTYFCEGDEPGTIRYDGARCEDITKLTFHDNSVDLIVSSDVLEHVPDFTAAIKESARVLVKGGMHVFTVPTSDKTVKRAEVVDGKVKHLMPPQYHSDPLNAGGILAFWTFGYDLPELFTIQGIRIFLMAGPEGKDGRVVWGMEKL